MIWADYITLIINFWKNFSRDDEMIYSRAAFMDRKVEWKSLYFLPVKKSLKMNHCKSQHEHS